MSSNKSSKERTLTLQSLKQLNEVMQVAKLSREEELVLRLRHGIPAPLDMPLSYRGQGDEALSAELALLEARNIAALASMGIPTKKAQEKERLKKEEERMKESVIERLKRM